MSIKQQVLLRKPLWWGVAILDCVIATYCAGEPDHGEATDEEESLAVKVKPAPEKCHAPQSVSVEVLVSSL